MPDSGKGYTTPHRCATVNESKRNQPSGRDQQARHKVQEKASDFHANFNGSGYLGIGPEAKRDIYNSFDPDKPISIHLDPPSTERPPLVEIKQEGKTSIYTTDFYFTNKSPSNIVVPSPSQNNTTPTGDQAAAATPTLFNTDPLQPGKIHLHSWMLYISQAPVLDSTGKDIKSKKTLKMHCPQCVPTRKQ